MPHDVIDLVKRRRSHDDNVSPIAYWLEQHARRTECNLCAGHRGWFRVAAPGHCRGRQNNVHDPGVSRRKPQGVDAAGASAWKQPWGNYPRTPDHLPIRMGRSRSRPAPGRSSGPEGRRRSRGRWWEEPGREGACPDVAHQRPAAAAPAATTRSVEASSCAERGAQSSSSSVSCVAPGKGAGVGDSGGTGVDATSL